MSILAKERNAEKAIYRSSVKSFRASLFYIIEPFQGSRWNWPLQPRIAFGAIHVKPLRGFPSTLD